MNKIICRFCGRDINAIMQDNMSYSCSYAMCEDCASGHRPHRPSWVEASREEDVHRFDWQKEDNDSEWGFHRSPNKSPWESRW